MYRPNPRALEHAPMASFSHFVGSKALWMEDSTASMVNQVKVIRTVIGLVIHTVIRKLAMHSIPSIPWMHSGDSVMSIPSESVQID